jgi:hypothetical protein
VKRLALIVLTLVGSTWSVVAAQTPDPLQSRVSIDYHDAPAAEVITALAGAVGLTPDISPGVLRPVTITLTNVRLGTALNAVCENAACLWRLEGALRVFPLAEQTAQTPFSLPPMMSFEIYDVDPREVFRAFAAVIDVPLSIETTLSTEPVTVRFRNAPPSNILNLLCSTARCQWRLDPLRGLRLIALPQ